jgi:hypothetical protein
MFASSSSGGRLIPVPEWTKYHPWPTAPGLRHLIFHRAKNGFERVIVRCGRRLLIDEAAFFDWARTAQRSGRIAA